MILPLLFGLFLGIKQQNYQQKNLLMVAFLYVGQGDAIFIEAPNGRQVLIDGGPGNLVISALSEIMPFYDRSIDLLIATHNDADHIGGFPEIFSRFDVAEYADYGLDEQGDLIDELKRAISAENLDKKIILRSGNEIILDEKNNIRLQILWPAENYESEDRNNYSVVARLVYGDSEFLLMGDAPIEVENYLINKFAVATSTQNTAGSFMLTSDVLKAGHHGSNTATSKAFLEKVAPKFVVFSAGLDNKFGHPHPEVVDLVKVSGARILKTFEIGNIVFETDGKNVFQTNF